MTYATKAQQLGDASVYKLTDIYKWKIIKASRAYHMTSLYVGLKILMNLVNTEKIDYMLGTLYYKTLEQSRAVTCTNICSERREEITHKKMQNICAAWRGLFATDQIKDVIQNNGMKGKLGITFTSSSTSKPKSNKAYIWRKKKLNLERHLNS